MSPAYAAADLEIPLQRITQITFAGSKTNALENVPWEIQASVSGGGTISFALEQWNSETILGRNKNFGKISKKFLGNFPRVSELSKKEANFSKIFLGFDSNETKQ